MSLEEQHLTTDTGAQATPDPVPGQGGAPQAGGEGGKPQAQPDRRTIAEGGGDQTETAATQPCWRDDWRDAMAGGDEDFRKALNRFQSPEGVAKSFREAQRKISSGQVKEPLPEKPTPEQLAAWRKDNGVPEKPEDYKIEPGGGFVFGEDDKPGLDLLRSFGHEQNWSGTQVNQVAGLYAQLSEKNRAAQDDRDKAFQKEAQTELREAWGRSYDANLQNFSNMVGRYGGPDLMNYLMGARGPDGARFGDNAAFLKMMTTLAREIHPIEDVMPTGTANAGKAAQEELDALTDMQRNDPDRYEKEGDGKHQKRKIELLTAIDKQQRRA